MDDHQNWRKDLNEMRDVLLSEIAAGEAATRPVLLDQQSVGRLSRMDALQNQAMARAGQRRRCARLYAVDAALARLDEGEFGFCVARGEKVSAARLQRDPAVAQCFSCLRGP